MSKPQVLDTKKAPDGGTVRLQRRGNGFDVTKNTTGFTVRYVVKGVSEQQARAAFVLATQVQP